MGLPWQLSVTHPFDWVTKGIHNTSMEIKLRALADFASVTREGKLNIMGIFDQINPVGFPALIPMMHLVVTYEASPAEGNSEKQVRIVLMSADGPLAELDQVVRVPAPERPGSRINVNQIVAIGGIGFQNPGDYSFVILVNGEEKGSLPFYVAQVPQQAIEGGSGNAP